MVEDPEETVDFAVVVYREEGTWHAVALPRLAATDLDVLLHALREAPGDEGSLGLVSIAEDFFVLARVRGPLVRLMLSDVTAATEWPLAGEVVDRLDLPMPDEEDEAQPAGDMSLLADLGMSAMELGVLCDDDDLYPDEMLEDLADRIGFGRAYAAAVDAVIG
ncbi:MAG: hypothetical protein GEU93_14495 [Propionibacteriales bacterium]|nr:hypothetical protein [Propionibacteriales bacterium]